jgi:hypothetical protein
MRGRRVANLVLRVIDHCKAKVADKEKLKQAEFVSQIFDQCWEPTKTEFLEGLCRLLWPSLRSDLKSVQGPICSLAACYFWFLTSLRRSSLHARTQGRLPLGKRFAFSSFVLGVESNLLFYFVADALKTLVLETDLLLDLPKKPECDAKRDLIQAGLFLAFCFSGLLHPYFLLMV